MLGYVILDSIKEGYDQFNAFERKEIKHGQLQEKLQMAPLESLTLKIWY